MSAFLSKLFFYYAWLHLSTLVHELAHAMVGQWVGFAPKRIQVGTGPGSFKFTVRGLECDFRLMPWGGIAVPSRIPYQGLSWRGALMIAAGPVADLCMLGLLISFWPLLKPDNLGGTLAAYKAIEFLIMMQIVFFLYSVVPHDATIEGRLHPNDGKQFIAYVTGKQTRALRDALTTHEPYKAAVARYTPDFEFEDFWLMNASPEELELLGDAENDLIRSRFEDAISKFERLLSNPKLRGGERACILDSLASIPVMHGHENSLDKALGWIREAQSLAPHSVTLRGSLGGALVQTGSYAEAIKILTPLTTPENEKVDKTVSALFLAKAWDKQGDAAQAAQWLAKATELGDYDDLRNRIAAELSPEAQRQSPPTSSSQG
ncbi:site-2 protease family protein [Roseimicrobium sp. ORNL1]|uniref:site-2 protease family protein n=1 Tax=Roseimicrobium sp. ORNL1 TaxID=2711231 RepID=UPI0013E132D3|nr:site-2 protease family protein [Roseimicrobium sp. ORNL1]QIF01476.1 hypothetical protein G5S37_08055 [Roseimicrobium sp. ORNL1]